jgi:hypothetical protein
MPARLFLSSEAFLKITVDLNFEFFSQLFFSAILRKMTEINFKSKASVKPGQKSLYLVYYFHHEGIANFFVWCFFFLPEPSPSLAHNTPAHPHVSDDDDDGDVHGGASIAERHKNICWMKFMSTHIHYMRYC